MRRFLVLLVACLLIGPVSCTSLTLPTPIQSDVLVEYRRSGGFLGLDDRLTIAKDGKTVLTRKQQRYEHVLNQESLQRIQQVLENAHFSTLEAEYLLKRQGADLIEYSITYAGHTVHTIDTAVPDSLQSVLDILNETIDMIQ